MLDGDGEVEVGKNEYSPYWQSIPDPPTPTTTTDTANEDVPTKSTTVAAVERPRRRHRKRDSFAFRDVTNQQQVSNNGDVDGENDFALGKTAAVSSKSFEPVPKSLREKDEDVGLDNILGIESEEA